MPKRVVLDNVTTKIRYVVHYQMPVCFDNGGPIHEEYHIDSSDPVSARSDRQAQLASLNDPKFRRDELCYHGRHAYPTSIEKIITMTTPDGWSSTKTETVPLPRSAQCACGHVFWPIKGEKACHVLVETQKASVV